MELGDSRFLRASSPLTRLRMARNDKVVGVVECGRLGDSSWNKAPPCRKERDKDGAPEIQRRRTGAAAEFPCLAKEARSFDFAQGRLWGTRPRRGGPLKINIKGGGQECPPHTGIY